MPKLLNNNDQEVFNTNGVGSFTFSGVRPDNLEETEYTLASIVVDSTSSVMGFETELIDAIKSAYDACKKSPKANNLLLRVTEFNSSFPNGVNEIHGFLPLDNIDPNDYGLNLGGATPLFDATLEGLGAIIDYGENLVSQDFDVNAIIFVITDGEDNSSTFGPDEVKARIEKCLKEEKVESITTVLVGVDLQGGCDIYLNDFKDQAGLTQFIDIGDATPGKLAKLAAFVSKSISSTSQALGTGASAPIGSLTI